jgi:pimeloyl-ACP methyl ester carboxylesterase
MATQDLNETVSLPGTARPAASKERPEPAEEGGHAPLTYDVLGAGDPLFWMSDGPRQPLALARPAASLLAEHFTLYLFEAGSGSPVQGPTRVIGSDPIDEARRYERLRGRLGIERVGVAGYAFGGLVALTYAALYPQQTRGCMAISPSDQPRGDRPIPAAVDVSSLLEQIRCPVLVLTGDKDGGRAQAQRLVAGVRRSKVLTIPACGEAPQEDDPQAVRAAILAWRWIVAGKPR